MKFGLLLLAAVVGLAQEPTRVRPEQLRNFEQLRWAGEDSATTRITTHQVGWGVFVDPSGRVCYNSLANSGPVTHGNEENWYLSPSCWDPAWVEVMRQNLPFFADILAAYGK